MHSSPRIPTWLGRLAVAGLLGARALSGQTGDETELAFQRLEQAMAATDYRAVQVRRVRGHFAGFGRGGEWVGALETALHRSAQGDAREGEFALELNGFEGVSMSPGELAQRQLLYRSRAAYLFRYQSFRVLDAQAAARHYVVQAMGEGVLRAQRRCNRVAVISRTGDRPSWLLDLDAGTGVPLYCGEFTPEGQLVAELDVLHIAYGAAAQIPGGSAWAWSPRMGIEEFASAQEARGRAQTIVALPLGGSDVGGGYVFDHARVITDPVTAEQTLVHVFHDGIDALFVSQRTRQELKEAGHTIRYYAEAGVHQFLFQHKHTEFLLVGRNASLRGVATRIYRAAVATL